jgi:hypothetical protein
MDSIFEIIEEDERVIAVFTTHDQWSSNLIINKDRTGSTGDWAIRSNPDVETVIIYHRVDGGNYIYKAKIVSIEGPLPKYKDRNRYKIYFSGCEDEGVTTNTWSDFANCGANPVRYINT